MTAPERSPERDAAILAILPHVPFDGWTQRALRRGLAEAGLPLDEADLLFPDGVPDLLAAFFDWTDRRMADGVATIELPARVHERVRAVMALRLAQNRPHKEAVRRALALLALAGNARLAAACTARSVDAIWHAAGDRSADFSWYTKRAILTGVFVTTTLYWLHDSGDDDAATLAFLDRRLTDVGRIGGLRRRAAGALQRFRPSSGAAQEQTP